MLDLPAQPRPRQAPPRAAASCSASRLDRPVAATTELRFRLAAPAVEPVDDPGGRRPRSARVRTASEESIVFQTSDDFTIPPARPMAYVVERGGQRPRTSASRTASPGPKGPDQLRLRARRPRSATRSTSASTTSLARLLLRSRRRLLAGARRRRRPRGPAAALGGLRRADGGRLDARRPCSPTCTGGFNYGSGAIELQLPTRHAAAPIAGQRAYWVRCRLDEHHALGRGQRRRTRTRPRSTRSRPAPIGARHPGRALGAGPVASCSARATARRASASSCATRPCSSRRRASTSRCSSPDAGQWERVGAARVVRRERARTTAHYVLDLRRRHDRARARRSARRTAAGGSTARVPPQGRDAAHDRATATAAGAAATSPPGTLTVLK